MALMEMNYKSKTLGMHQSFTVILPEDDSYFNPSNKPKLLKSMLLLHGISSDHASYMRYTSIERYANAHQLAIIMPSADHSFYTNMKYGHSYYDYVLEVWDYVHQLLPLSQERKDHFIAGHSMGGYGTLRYALTAGERFSKAAPLSSAIDVSQVYEFVYPDFKPAAIAGEDYLPIGTEYDPYHLVDEAIKKGKAVPEIVMMCGTEDPLYESNAQFFDYISKHNIPSRLIANAGEHNYDYWDKAIKTIIEMFTTEDE
ncbi:esterase family protein [Staphylococcus agnetis]|uniref:alpha/beta hydrolase n=1 Tax=Staphylococcus agnetis TaxID=985762 RepID=UPI00208EDB06|nr:esterase family protein [Staphylococcus agnetis]MCO4354040.1 esterase family protein [Staphylococcus agnetis]MCO4358874.1 esterase family protein [Staphylococcus agnetis]MCO4363570.1 esterase family protein [Staphylococcus agnetis]MCO4370558.1 esterase family protein [Staphylococcus agnetis]